MKYSRAFLEGNVGAGAPLCRSDIGQTLLRHAIDGNPDFCGRVKGKEESLVKSIAIRVCSENSRHSLRKADTRPR